MKHEAELVGELFPGLPAAPEKAAAETVCTRVNYVAECEKRYGGWTLQDALDNWFDFEERREVFGQWCDHFRRDPQLRVGPKAHNPAGTLTGMVWVMQSALDPDRSCLHPCLDFEEHFQVFFIRRGLMAYLTLLLRESLATDVHR